jgi:hypothetical protein
VSDDSAEVQLQAGHEITIGFDDLATLTGLPGDVALSRLHEGRDVDLRVVGAGHTSRVVKVDLGNF